MALLRAAATKTALVDSGHLSIEDITDADKALPLRISVVMVVTGVGIPSCTWIYTKLHHKFDHDDDEEDEDNPAFGDDDDDDDDEDEDEGAEDDRSPMSVRVQNPVDGRRGDESGDDESGDES